MTDSTWGTDEEIWQTISPPMVPVSQDLELVRQAIPPELLARDAAPRVLVLGVTPALIGAPWPARTQLHAVDYDRAMIELQWHAEKGHHCHCALWQAMPFPDEHFDLIVGDCSFNALPSIADYSAVLREIGRVRKPGAPLVVRFFMQAEPRLSLANLPEAVAGPLAGLSPGGLRLLLVLAASGADGRINLRDVPQGIAALGREIDDYLAEVGLDEANRMRAKHTYQLDQRLNYPDRSRIEREFGPFFDDIAFNFPAYDVGSFCPTVSVR